MVEFREDTPQELDKVLADLKSKGMESLILDVRNNPGGLLDKAVEVAARFLPNDTLIVSTRGRDVKQNTELKSHFKHPDTELPIVLLVNDGSASGSEILAGVFQDYRRAVVLGTKTFGKGSVQTVLPLRDGSALKLTTSLYATPKGRIINNVGILPDIVVEPLEGIQASSRDKEAKELEKIFEGVEEKKPQEAPVTAEKTPEADAQLSRAVDLLKSLEIYKSLNNK